MKRVGSHDVASLFPVVSARRTKGGSYSELAFLVLLALFVVDYVFSESQFDNISAVHQVLFAMRYAVLAAVLFLFVVKNKTGPMGMLIAMLLLAVVSVCNAVLLGGGIGVLPIALFALASYDIQITKIFKVTIGAFVLSYLLVIIGSQVGLIEDVVSVRVVGTYAGPLFSGEYARHNFGFLNANQIPMALFAIYALFIVYRADGVRWFEHSVFMILNIAAFFLCGSRTVLVLTALACVICCVIQAADRANRSKGRRVKRQGQKVPLLFLACPLCALASLAMVALYIAGGDFATFLNLHLNNRLLFASDVLSQYDIGLFGIAKDIGSKGFELATVIDNGYIILMLRQGVLVAATIVILVSYLTYSAEKSGNRYLVLVLVLFAVSNVVNSVLTDFVMIPFYCMLFNSAHDVQVFQGDMSGEARATMARRCGSAMMLIPTQAFNQARPHDDGRSQIVESQCV